MAEYSCLLCLHAYDEDEVLVIEFGAGGGGPASERVLCRGCVADIAAAAQRFIEAGTPDLEDTSHDRSDRDTASDLPDRNPKPGDSGDLEAGDPSAPAASSVPPMRRHKARS